MSNQQLCGTCHQPMTEVTDPESNSKVFVCRNQQCAKHMEKLEGVPGQEPAGDVEAHTAAELAEGD